MQGLSRNKWWQSLLLSFGIASAGLAIPIQVIIANNYNTPAAHPSVLAIILIILAYQVAPTALLFAAERSILRFIGTGKALNIFWGGVFAVASLLLLRSLLSSLGLGNQAPFLRSMAGGLAVGGIVAMAILAIWLFLPHRIIAEYFMALGVVALIWTGVFVYQMGFFAQGKRAPQGQDTPSFPALKPVGGLVLILLFDGLGSDVLLKDGHLDTEKFPNFAALGRDSAVFLNGTSNYGGTDYSIPSMLNGRFMDEGDPCRNKLGSCSTDILSILASKGYQISMYTESLDCKAGGIRCFGEAQLIQKYPHRFVAQMGLLFIEESSRVLRRIYPWRVFYGVAQFRYHLNSQPLFSEFLNDIKNPNSGSILYVHLVLSHDPYVFDKDGNRRIPLWAETDYPSVQKAYEEQVQFVDTLLGALVAQLKTKGLYNESIVIATGDHGPRPFKSLDSHFPQEINGVVPRVPLIIHGPGIKPQVSLVDYQHIDFKPTLMDILGLPPEDGMSGVSAFAPQRPDRDKVFYYPIDTSGKWGEFTYQGDTGRWVRRE